MRLLLAGGLLAVLGILAALPVGAASGVSIDVGRIAVSEVLSPGAEYRLPTFGVRNPGDETTSYRITVSYLDGQQANQPPVEWFSFSPPELTLEAGASRAVQTRLVIPPDAEAGDYAALIGPQIVSQAGGAQVGAAAAARLSFSVGQCGGLECWLRWLSRAIGENPVLLVVPVALLGGAALYTLRRRFTFNISRRAD